MSKVLRQDLLAELGELHYGRKRIQPASREIRGFYERAREVLRFPILEFDAVQRAVVAEAFQRVIEMYKYTCYAFAIMPDHVHLVIRKHRDLAEEMIVNFQRESHLLLRERGFRDLEHPVWGGPGWKAFLDHPNEIWRTIDYVEQNPVRIGLPVQRYDFVTRYDNWPLHEGHDPNSPYARRLRGW
jgi:REP element-mobilizing transposase RayT